MLVIQFDYLLRPQTSFTWPWPGLQAAFLPPWKLSCPGFFDGFLQLNRIATLLNFAVILQRSASFRPTFVERMEAGCQIMPPTPSPRSLHAVWLPVFQWAKVLRGKATFFCSAKSEVTTPQLSSFFCYSPLTFAHSDKVLGVMPLHA